MFIVDAGWRMEIAGRQVGLWIDYPGVVDRTAVMDHFLVGLGRGFSITLFMMKYGFFFSEFGMLRCSR